jgi:hypothetical protein
VFYRLGTVCTFKQVGCALATTRMVCLTDNFIDVAAHMVPKAKSGDYMAQILINSLTLFGEQQQRNFIFLQKQNKHILIIPSWLVLHRSKSFL